MNRAQESLLELYHEYYRETGGNPTATALLVLAAQLQDLPNSISEIAGALSDSRTGQALFDVADAVKKSGTAIQNGLMQVGIAVHQHR